MIEGMNGILFVPGGIVGQILGMSGEDLDLVSMTWLWDGLI
jgi:hypothetical protein